MTGTGTTAVAEDVTSHEPNAALLRRTMGTFTTGVAVVTVEVGRELHGMTLNSLTSVSLDPPLLLVCLMEDARTTRSIREANAFAVNILRQRQRGIANHFAKRGDQRLASPGLHRDERGVPYIPDSLAHIHCTVDAVHPGGDHVIVVGRIYRCEAHDGEPLVFCRGAYHRISGEGEAAEWYW